MKRQKRTVLEKRKRNPGDTVRRVLPVGPEVMPTGGVHFRVWAPRREAVSVVLEGKRRGTYPLLGEKGGYFSGLIPAAKPGTLYRYQLDENALFPDPASRYQPMGPEGPSQIVDSGTYKWSDEGWSGAGIQGQVIYEMHIGTFTAEGTWKAAVEYFETLVETGITLLELMPVHEFSGKFGWGYDGVFLFAPYHIYGAPDEFRSFVDQAHAAGLGVVLDVLYNHFGPVGNCMSEFSLDYFTDRYETEWGYAINFDGSNSAPVREFFIANAEYWIREFHLDGLRLDATQAIHDRSSKHIIASIIKHVREEARGRSVVIIAENEPQNFRLIAEVEEGGFGGDAVWNDDFHHSAIVSLTGRNEGYYSDYHGSPQELISAAKWGYLYQGQFYPWQNKCRGTPVLDFAPSCFIHYLQNHDQIANTPGSQRIHLLSHPGKLRAVVAFFLLIPATPMLFQGQEFNATSPFIYFADHEGELAKVVYNGRIQFLKQFQSFLDPQQQAALPEPADASVFQRCKLNHSERHTHFQTVSLYRDLLWLRRKDPVFSSQRTDWMHGAVLCSDAFIIRFLGDEKGDRLLVVNLGLEQYLVPAPEPLLAPPENSHWEILWSSEATAYGGSGTPPVETEGKWLMPGNAAIIFAPKKVVRLYYG